ncbi:hypothetical protein ACH4F6_00385 [Streptomyces sp. NPDC017936]|uniref:hypothetical protein n=1 Tax=Streptomyces sp. NPDC017936 TaxID=3365016 RepID=UPI0037ABC696
MLGAEVDGGVLDLHPDDQVQLLVQADGGTDPDAPLPSCLVTDDDFQVRPSYARVLDHPDLEVCRGGCRVVDHGQAGVVTCCCAGRDGEGRGRSWEGLSARTSAWSSAVSSLCGRGRAHLAGGLVGAGCCPDPYARLP